MLKANGKNLRVVSVWWNCAQLDLLLNFFFFFGNVIVFFQETMIPPENTVFKKNYGQTEAIDSAALQWASAVAVT